MSGPIVYDVAKEASFKNVSEWAKGLREYGDKNIVIMLVGNKTGKTDENENEA